ncbi:MAG: glycosyltransferase [Candidatus Omnitrophica bacterium]|nr:glycosyltransferase [Candidatus Omnitrophota bacterium]
MVDEADSVLIDEARTPLIISSPAPTLYEKQVYREALELARMLKPQLDFVLDRGQKRLELTESGKEALAAGAAARAGLWKNTRWREELIQQALSAIHLFHRDKDYLVRDQKIQIVDLYTGRVMGDRSWEQGLHQLIETKEQCPLTAPTEAIARISYQRFFRRYRFLAGMTGTAREVANELWAVYRLPVVTVPPNQPSARSAGPLRLFPGEESKWQAVTGRILQIHQRGRPVLVGTRSVAASGLRPDLIVGHSGFVSTAWLRDLYGAPLLNLFEYFYHPRGTDMDFRPEFPPRPLDFLRSRMRNAAILIDLHTCDAGYTPTQWQHDLFPLEYQPKLRVIHDGIDTAFWRRRPGERTIGEELIPDEVRIVTYVTRGFEAMRGFDIFVRAANRLAARMPNVLFVCVGSKRTCYGNDLEHIQAPTFFDHVMRTEQPDVRRFRFPGWLPPEPLARILSVSDLHIYLTVPFVLSWSVLNALACECVVLASDTAPVREFIRHGENGWLVDFFDADALAESAYRILCDLPAYRGLGATGRALIEAHYSLDVTFPRLWRLFQDCVENRA